MNFELPRKKMLFQDIWIFHEEEHVQRYTQCVYTKMRNSKMTRSVSDDFA